MTIAPEDMLLARLITYELVLQGTIAVALVAVPPPAGALLKAAIRELGRSTGDLERTLGGDERARAIADQVAAMVERFVIQVEIREEAIRAEIRGRQG